MRIQDMKSN